MGLAGLSYAGEAVPKEHADDAAAVGRGLISHDEEVRSKAIDALADAMGKGHVDAKYLDALSKAAATWANSTDRLADVWIERAVEGDARERRVASRLLHALGPQAVERLALELRHQRHRPEITSPVQQTAKAEPKPTAQPAPTTVVIPEQDRVANDKRITKIYKVQDLVKAGMHALQIRSFLQKNANASEVSPYGDRYVVLAEVEGHRSLVDAMAKLLEQRMQQTAAEAQTLDAAKPGYGTQGAKSGGVSAKKEAKDKQPKKPESLVEVEPQPASPAKWRLTPVVMQVPREEATLLYGKAQADAGVVLLMGTSAEGKGWIEAARKLPDTRELGRWDPLSLANKQGGTISAGETYDFKKSIKKTKGGAYGYVFGRLHEGYVFEFRPNEIDDTMILKIETTRASITRPIPVRLVQPAKDAAVMKVETPHWSRTQSKTSVSISKTPTSILLGFQGLDEQQPNDDVVLILTIEEK